MPERARPCLRPKGRKLEEYVGNSWNSENRRYSSEMAFRFDGFTLDPDRAELIGPDGPVHIEKHPFDLLVLLAENAGLVVSRDELLAEVWDGRIVSALLLNFKLKQDD